MDAELYSQSIQYEQLTQSIYQAILAKEGVNNIDVEHNVSLKGKSGVEHQIDVLWKFKQAGVEHKVLIECKNYASSLTLEKVRNFFAVLHDIGNSNGLMVTKTGYQSGAKDFAEHYGIGLKILRKPIEQDWENRIKDIHLNIVARSVSSSEETPLTAELLIKPNSPEQEERLEALNQAGKLSIPSGADICLLDQNGEVSTEEMRWFLPRSLDTIDKEEGGPYTQKIALENKYLYVNEGTSEQELVEIMGIVATYYVESYSEEVISHGDEVVELILKDFSSNDVEHVQRR
ncbi:restriction endonuclease [Pseudoalteromonas sp. XMcav1-K]|uniref:restriction endonuclease n=1 Tax=Pseudoalteromonas sp. XMcav1-K TaxID=3374372 RepID=UPI00375833B2